jgi:hypothetical protein
LFGGVEIFVEGQAGPELLARLNLNLCCHSLRDSLLKHRDEVKKEFLCIQHSQLEVTGLKQSKKFLLHKKQFFISTHKYMF